MISNIQVHTEDAQGTQNQGTVTPPGETGQSKHQEELFHSKVPLDTYLRCLQISFHAAMTYGRNKSTLSYISTGSIVNSLAVA